MALLSRAYGVSFTIPMTVKATWPDCLEAYNQTVFRYLDARYGSAWRKLLRDDVYGLR